jgi:intracellular sulfur oxidation DsrE/DsrF family protein
MISKSLLSVFALSLSVFVTAAAHAQPPRAGDKACPVNLVSGLDLETEFGPGTAELTRCNERRHHVKLLVQINRFCDAAVSNADCKRPYALGNLANVIDDYEITHGMVAGRDYEIAAVVHGSGGYLLLKNGAAVTANQFEAQVRTLIAKGVKFYFCQNTARAFIQRGEVALGGFTNAMIDGVEYTPAGLTALADMQASGWSYIQP